MVLGCSARRNGPGGPDRRLRGAPDRVRFGTLRGMNRTKQNRLGLFALAGPGLVFAAVAAGRPDLYDNGPFITHANAGAGGAGLSLLQSSLSCQVYGYTCSQITAPVGRLADDFTVPASGWSVSSIVFYGFQSGSGTGPTTFTSVNLRIWSARPGTPGATVLFGDTTTNRFVGAAWTGAYRAPEADITSTNRPIYAVEAAVNPPLQLGAGTYWLDWQASGTIASGPWTVPVTILGQTGAAGANAYSFTNGQWTTIHDTGNNAPQDMAFVIRGTGGAPSCYANCDHSSAAPCLNVLDFSCFLNSFAAGQSFANCDLSTTTQVLNVLDFSCFLNKFAAGCSSC